MEYNPVGWFEIPVTDTDRATKFYESLLNIHLKRQDQLGFEMTWFPMEAGLKGASGALMKGMGYEPSRAGTVIYFTCPDIDDALVRAEQAAGKVLLPKKDIGEYGYIAWVEDTEGNTIGLHTLK